MSEDTEPTLEQRKDAMRRMFFGALADFNDSPLGWPLISVKGWTIGIGTPNFIDKIRNFPIGKGDVIVGSFPKSGTTWMQHIVYLLVTEDFEGGQTIPIDQRVPELELPTPYPCTPENLDAIVERKEKSGKPIIVKTHLPPPFLPYTAFDGKMIYVYRNPKDVVVSMYHHAKNMPPSFYDGPFEVLVEEFMRGRVIYGPWERSVKAYCDCIAEGKPILLVSFDDMKRDHVGIVRKVAKFLEKDASEELIQKVVDATTFEAMRNNDSANYSWLTQMTEMVRGGSSDECRFVRSGKSGGWRTHFTPEMLARFEPWLKEATQGIPLKFED